MSSAAVEREIDPITFGVLRHKLDQIIAEAYYTIGRVSGSTVVYEAGDHQEAIVTPDGDLAAFGAGVLHWCKSIGAAVSHVAARFAENPGFAEGDQYLFNDPYVACVHANDVQVLAPVFYGDELIAWAGSASHQNDVGGVDVGSICLNAENIYQEGFLTEGLKVVEGGQVRRDVEDLVRNMTRIPDLNVLDIRAKIASNNVIRARLLEMVGRYGLETIRALFRDLQRYSEDRVRARLRQIPDGRFTAVNYVEGIRQPWIKVQIAAIKHDDQLTMDFTGSSDQTSGSDNISRIGAVSSAMNPFISMICHDIPWNEGLFRAVEFIMPEGSIVNPVKPAAVSASTPAGANILVMTAAQNALSKMVLSSEQLCHEACANIGAAFNMPVLSGINRDGSFFAQLILDVLAGGMGALPDRDGADSAQNHWCVKSMIANVESNELLYPFMFLWRREVPDSGGAGQFRGGLGVEDAVIAWDATELDNMNLGVGHEPRDCLGLAGGYPAAQVQASFRRGADVPGTLFAHGRLPASTADLQGETERIEAKSISRFAAEDVLIATTSSGGGGFGDPLLRDPAAVVADIDQRRVSAAMATAVYGVVVASDGTVDETATCARRSKLRDARLRKGTG